VSGPGDPLVGLADPLPVAPVVGLLDAEVTVPGSKSITNRALVVAALAGGTSRLEGILDADDTAAMIGCLRTIGVGIDHDPGTATAVVEGVGGVLADGPRTLDARMSGTTARFVLPVLALAGGPVLVDGAPSLRARPMGEAVAALRGLGARVDERGEPGRLPLEVRGAPGTVEADEVAPTVRVAGDVSSQFLSGLAMVGPCLPGGLVIELTGPLVSRPYVAMTLAVMDAFGARTAWEGERLVIAPGGYDGRGYAVEPDASAASYPLAAAAVVGGRVRVRGLDRTSLQGDVGFADVLGQMGATVRFLDGAVEVERTGPLRGVTVDMSQISDTAQTLAAVAVGATGPTEVTGIGFIRAKETDRVGAVVAELDRLGIEAHETDDGFRIVPGTPTPGVVRTYDDHRMAMAFALLGLAHPGIAIADPGCVAKTFPGYWDLLADLRRSTAGR
jgi:3-phosphoshikimate 1-carboxyvinyltransferase